MQHIPTSYLIIVSLLPVSSHARDLVFVFSNGRLVDKMHQSEEGFVGWDEEEEEMEGSDSEQE